jgi:hypothetical protein
VIDRLQSALSVPVRAQKQAEGEEPTPPFVIVETPESEARGDIKNDTGYELTQRIRIHTRYPKGKADLSKREEIASNVYTALENSLSVSGHNILHLPTPDVIPQTYEAGGDQAFDLLLDYELLTQTQ